MNTYTWKIEQLDCYPTKESQSNVIFDVHYRVIATSSQNQNISNSNGDISTIPYITSIYATQQLTYVAGNPFTEFKNLTEDIIVKWVQSALGTEQVTSIQNNLDTQLENIINPPIVSPRLPWAI